jgi:hypothetical protein
MKFADFLADTGKGEQIIMQIYYAKTEVLVAN